MRTSRSVRPRLGLSVRELVLWGSREHEAYLEAVARSCRRWIDRGGEVLAIPQCTYDRGMPESDDRALALQVARRVDREDFRLVRGIHAPEVVRRFWGTCQAALCTRLHANVLAALEEVPTVALSYEAKVEGFWQGVGVTESVLPWNVPAERIDRALDTLGTWPRALVHRGILRQQRLSAGHRDVLHRLLESGRGR